MKQTDGTVVFSESPPEMDAPYFTPTQDNTMPVPGHQTTAFLVSNLPMPTPPQHEIENQAVTFAKLWRAS